MSTTIPIIDPTITLNGPIPLIFKTYDTTINIINPRATGKKQSSQRPVAHIIADGNFNNVIGNINNIICAHEAALEYIGINLHIK